MRGRQRADAEQRGDHRHPGLLRELAHGIVGTAQHHPVADHEERPLGGGDEAGRGAHGVLPRPLVWGSGLGVRGSSLRGPIPEPRVPILRLLVLHVLRHVDHHRAGPALARDRDRLAHAVGQLGDVGDETAVLGDGQGDSHHVGFLEGIAAQHGARHLSRDGDHRGRVHLRGGEAGDQVGGAGTRRGDADADAPAGARVTVRRVRRRLLVPHQDMTDLGGVAERVVERHDGASGVAPDGVHAFLHQDAAEDLRAGQELGHVTPPRGRRS